MTAPEQARTFTGTACSFGCGNPCNFILVDMESSDTQFLCVPCFLHIADNMVEAIINPNNPAVVQALIDFPVPEQAGMEITPNGRSSLTTSGGETFTVCGDCGAPDGMPHDTGCIFDGT